MLVRMGLDLPRDARYVAVMRNVARCVMDDLGVPQEARQDIELALTEACANVVKHVADVELYSVDLEISERGCTVEVVDEGAGFEAEIADAAGGEVQEHGRGVPLMRALVDELQFVREEGTTKVRLIKHWPGVAQPTGAAAGSA